MLEANDLAILLRSDQRAHIDDGIDRLRASGLLKVTSLRRGFAGGSLEGGVSLPRTMARAANVPGADLIPEGSELFMGFTSTQKAAFGPGKIANFETLGYVDLRDSGYFREGTHMHLSHVTEDLEAWYVNFAFDERVTTAFRPGLDVPEGTQVVPMGPEQASDTHQVRRQFHQTGRIGHSASIQTTSRLQQAATGPDGTHYPKGTAIPIRADFNTLDNPFFYSAEPNVIQEGPMAGIHFLVFNPSSDDFNRNRLAMDGVLPSGNLRHPAERPCAGVQLGAQHHPPPELHRAAAPAPQLPARRALSGGRARIRRVLARADPRDPRPRSLELGRGGRPAEPDGADRPRRRRDARTRRRPSGGSRSGRRLRRDPAPARLGRPGRREPRVAAHEPATSGKARAECSRSAACDCADPRGGRVRCAGDCEQPRR